jgi:S-DNA-T family DNA segregation ATPase FtsK/SpoIIIE
MSADDKKKLDGIEEGANKYVHPTDPGSKHIPAGGADKQILSWASDGTAKWTDFDLTSLIGVVTHTKNGIMTAADKMKLDAIDDEENKYIFINLLSIKHNQKIEIRDEFPELLKLHCRHGFDILENEISSIGINDNIVDFFINQLEEPKNINFNNINKKNENDNVELLQKLKNAIQEIKAPLKFSREKSFERIRKFYFDIEDINYVPALFRTDFIAKLEVATALRDKIYVDKTKEERQISINVLKDNQPIYIAEFESELNNNDLSFIVGMDDEDNILQAKLSDLVHLLVAGTTGSGKTVFLHSLIYQFLKKNVELYLIDGKNGYEFGKYSEHANVISDNEEIVPVIKEIIDEMEDRFASNSIPNDLPIVIIVDEFVDLIMQKKLIEDLFVRLSQKGRGAKIHLILATQRPDSNILKGVLRSNLPSRIAFKVQKSSESKIILDEIGAENLFGKGDMLFSNGNEIKRLQGFLI